MRSSHSTEESRKAFRAITSIAIVVVVLAAATVAVRAAYGAFSDDIRVETRFARAGQALRPGSDVKYRGVNVGKVRSIDLRDRGIDVVLQLQRDVEIPADTTATVRAKTLFGEKYVELAVPDEPGAPFLTDGATVAAGGTGVEVEDLLDSTDDLLRGVDATELATLMDELVQASQGEGARVAHLIERGVDATEAMAGTLDAQLRAIDSFQRFARQYRDIGPTFNSVNRNFNELLPTFNAARDDFVRLLRTLKPFADNLAEFVEVNEADFAKILADGDNIVRVLTARKENISETIRGLDVYSSTLADAVAPGTLPDGSRYGNMKLFIDFGDVRALLCTVIGSDSGEVELSALREALAQRVPELTCPGDGSGSGAAPGAAPAPAAPPQSPQDPDPLTELVSAIATPDATTNGGTVGDVLVPLLGSGG